MPRCRSSLSLFLIHWFCMKLRPLDVEKNHKLSVFCTFFSLSLQIFIWYLVHCFAIPRYSLSSSLVLIHWFFTKVMALGKISQIISFPDFLSLVTDIHLIFGKLFCHTKLQFKFKFGLYPFEFH
jgi:hypothetical protein